MTNHDVEWLIAQVKHMQREIDRLNHRLDVLEHGLKPRTAHDAYMAEQRENKCQRS